MSFTKKVVTTYSKSLFQNVRSLKSSKTETFDISQVLVPAAGIATPTIYQIGEELSLLKSVLTTSKKLRTFFSNPTYSEKQKAEILSALFPGFSLTTKSFLKVLTERTHLSLLPEIAEEYTKLLLKVKQATKVKLSVASALEESYGPGLLSTLKSLTASKEVTLAVSYNPKLLGGLILEYNSTSIDASILKEFSLFFNDL